MLLIIVNIVQCYGFVIEGQYLLYSLIREVSVIDILKNYRYFMIFLMFYVISDILYCYYIVFYIIIGMLYYY